MYFHSALDLIHHTPLVYLPKLSQQYHCHLYLKLEKYNLSGSSKDRAVKEMLLTALKEKKINSDTTIIEPTSGNTGISLAAICASLSLKCMIVLPSNSNLERIKIIQSYGGKIIKTPAELKMKGSIQKVKELLKSIPNSFSLSQFDNTNNPYAHYLNSGLEIHQQLPTIDAFYATSGTGGSISGIGKYFKENKPDVAIIHVLPQQKNHQIIGIKPNIEPKNYQKKYIDYRVLIDDALAFKTLKELATQEGLFLGLSSACAIAGALKDIAKKHYQNVVIFCADGGERYLTHPYLHCNLCYEKKEVISDLDLMYRDLFNHQPSTIWIKYYLTQRQRNHLYKTLMMDAKAIYLNDPSCQQIDDVIAHYPGFYAIFAYRIAHLLVKDFYHVSKIISEHAHQLTAIDIHPRAVIKEGFCIDHGSGIVIGETCKIGKDVRLYQGVTLGAKSLNRPLKVKNKKRHPTILNHVIIYANATILGGNTIIGENCIIGCNVLITNSIPNHQIVSLNQQNYKIEDLK